MEAKQAQSQENRVHRNKRIASLLGALLLFLSPLLFFSCGSRGGSTATTGGVGEVVGKVVFEDGSAASGATVKLIGGSSQNTTTDSSGAFTFVNITPGTYQISVSLTNYQTATTSVTIVEGQILDAGTLTLKVSAREKLNTAWSALDSGNYSEAKTAFNEVLTSSDATASQRSDAYVGLGWATFLGDTSSTKNSTALADFNSALNEKSDNIDAQAGALQMLVLTATGSQDLTQAVTYGQAVLTADAQYQFAHPPALDAADVHALLGNAYFLLSDKDPNDANAINAQAQIEAALTLDPTHSFALSVKTNMTQEGLWQ